MACMTDAIVLAVAKADMTLAPCFARAVSGLAPHHIDSKRPWVNK
jgi:hypothetical protein